MKAEFINGYYYISSDSDSLAGEESSILRVEAKEFVSFIDSFIFASSLHNVDVVKAVEKREKYCTNRKYEDD
ncbi:MAG: hypothetical protein WC149_12125 [Arcobacteraceae bacterium]